MKRKLLLLTMLSALSIGTWADTTSPYTGVAVGDITSGNSFYLYNVDFGKWLGDNDRNTVYGWTSHAEIGSRGRDIQITAIDGGYQLNPKLGNNHSINSSNLYMDTSADLTTWTISALDNGISNAVSIKCGNKGLAVNDSGDMDESADSGEKHNNWQIVTAEERWRVAKNNAKAVNPVDVSWCVLGGTFPVADEHRSNGTWTGTTNGNSGFGDNANGGDGTIKCNRVWEMWNITSKDVYQTITVPNGIYKVSAKAAYVSTSGNSMSSTHYDEWKADPTGNTKGIVYANSQSTPMINAYAMTSDSKVDNKITKDLDNGKWVSNGTNQFSTRMFAGDFKTDDIWVNVTDGTLKVGVKVEDGGGTSWILFDDFTVTYYGDYGEELRRTIALCKVQNTNNNPQFSAAISAAEDDLEVSEVHITALETLRTARNLYAMGYHEDVFTGTELAAGDYYLYNVGAKRFLCGYGNWGTHVAVGYTARPVTLAQSGSGWTIQTHLPNGNEGVNDFLGANGYVDTNSKTEWLFEQVSEGIYRIINPNNNLYLGYNAATRNNFYQVDSDCSGADNPNNQWKLVTKAERDALLENASESNPVDATYYIKRPGYDNREGGWTLWSENNYGANGVYDGSGNHRSYVWQTWDAAKVDHYQEITGLRPGIYEVSVQGFYRWGDTDQTVAEKNDNDNIVQGAYLYAYGEGGSENEQRAFLMSILDEQGNLPGIGMNFTVGGVTAEMPVNCYDHSMQYFEAGLYNNNKVIVNVGSDGTLHIGIYKTQNDKAHDWVVLDNWRLKYLGPTSESVTVTNAGYATYCSENALDFTGTDIKAYVGTKKGDKLTFTPITEVPANTGLLLVCEGGKTEDVSVIASAAAVEGNCLVGVNEETTLTSEDYILNVVNGGAGFYKVGSFTTLGAHKAYIPATVGNGVKGFTIDLEDDATGIRDLKDSNDLKDSEVIYNLAGQRLSKTQKGVNIVNGKKTLF